MTQLSFVFKFCLQLNGYAIFYHLYVCYKDTICMFGIFKFIRVLSFFKEWYIPWSFFVSILGLIFNSIRKKRKN